MASFPELQGDSQSGKTMMWSVRVFEQDGVGIIETTHGYLDGKKQVNQKVIDEGKNIGKKNETSPLQQAINEARSAWVKKKESGYSALSVTGVTDSADGNDDTIRVESEAHDNGRGKGITEDVPSPMLAHDYNKRGKAIKFPCFVQRKFDGTRCVGMPGKGLYSRNKKRYPHLDHIIAEVNRLPPTVILDGELYSETLTFQEIVGIVKRETLKKVMMKNSCKLSFTYMILLMVKYPIRTVMLIYKCSSDAISSNIWFLLILRIANLRRI